MGLFSDDLDYRDLDALCIKVKRTVADGATIELPLYVDARISFVTFPKAKEVIIEGSTVKDLKKSGKLLGAFKPIFEKYITDEVNVHPEYAEQIFPHDFYGEPRLEFNERHAKEHIGYQLFKKALTKIDNPNDFDEVKFEKIYGIAPVGFKIRDISCGVTMPYDISGIIGSEQLSDEKDAYVEPDADTSPAPVGTQILEQEEIDRLRGEANALETKCAQKQSEIQSTKECLEKTLISIKSLEGQLKSYEDIIAQYGNDNGHSQEALSKCSHEIEKADQALHDLELKRQEKQTLLADLKTKNGDEETDFLYSIIQHNQIRWNITK